jgi:beta-glucanase (GH16 family)
MRRHLRALLTVSILTAGHLAHAADSPIPPVPSRPSSDEPPTKFWYRQEPLDETPKRVTDAYPLSDQQNEGRWVRFEPMSDEFEGKELDRGKWTLGMEWWKGRPPALFSDKNVTVSNGKLQLTTRKETLPPEVAPLGYHDYTSAALHTKVRFACGYYEVKAKAMNSAASSSCFFQQDETPGWGTEIDLFEIGANAKQWERTVSFTVHIFRTPTKSYRIGPEEGQNWHSQYLWKAPWRPADDYHIYGLDWGEKVIGFYVDGVLIRSVENTHWHQPQYLIFDSEIFPHWFGIPDDKDLPSTFNVEYVRVWKKTGVQ